MELLISWLISFVVWNGVMLGTVFSVDRLIIPRRDAIVPKIRRLQSLLKVPRCLSVVSDNTTPGITDQSLRLGAELTVYFGLCSASAISLGAIWGKDNIIWGVAFGLVVPVRLFTSIWVYLIFARRKLDKGKRVPDVEMAGANTDLRESIARVTEHD